MESVALTCALIMPALLLQKPHQSAKVKEYISYLEWRLKVLNEGGIHLLLHEGRTIQSQLSTKPRSARSEAELARTFAKLMFAGKIRPAIRLLTDRNKGGSLNSEQKSCL